MISFLEQSEKPTQESIDQMNTFLEQYNIEQKYLAIYVIDSQGLTRASTDIDFIGKNYSFRRYFQQAIQGNNYIDSALGVTSGDIGLYYASPVRNMENEIIGVVVLKQSPQFLEQVMYLAGDLETGELLLADSFGVVLFGQIGPRNGADTKKMQTLGELSTQDRSQIEQFRLYEGVEFEPLGYAEVAESLGDLEDVAIFYFHDMRTDQEAVMVAKQIGQEPYFVLLYDSLVSVRGNIQQLAILAAFGTFGVGLLPIVFMYVVMKRASRPLSKLIRGAQDVADGKYKKVGIDSNDEFGTLARAFNEMVSSVRERDKKLQDAKRGLEKRVEEKTMELQENLQEVKRLNKALVGRELKMVKLKDRIKELTGEDTIDGLDDSDTQEHSQAGLSN